MGKKKLRSGKKNRKKGRSDDVKASTSLPPSVDGQLRCFLRVTVSKIKWDLRKAPEVFYLRLKWWGEQTDGSLYRPWDGREETKPSARKTARYPIRCGPKQFAEYLNAMSTCVFELLRGDQLTCIGKATISELGVLAPQNPISGVYPIFLNQKAEKLAEVTVSMKFEPLPVSYDSSSSVPTTDISLPTHSGHTTDGSTAPQPILKRRAHQRVPPIVTATSEEVTAKSRPTLSGIDDDLSFVIGLGAGGINRLEEAHAAQKSRGLQQSVGVIPDSAVSDSGPDISIRKTGPSPKVRGKYEVQPTSEVGKRLISTILDKGNQLMDSMIRAQCVAQPKGPEGPIPDSSMGPTPSAPAAYPLRRSSSGELFRELLRDEEVGKGRPSLLMPAEREQGVDPTLQLVIGDDISEKELKHLKTAMETSPVESDISEGFDGLSTDSDDPLHEDSILEELFYKGQRTSSDSECLSDLLLTSDSESEAGGRNRKQHKKDKLRSRRIKKKSLSEEPAESMPGVEGLLDESAAVADRQTNRDGEEPGDLKDSASDEDSSSVATLLHMSTGGVEGLSVQRLTLLGRVHAARVAIDTLTLTQRDPVLSTRTRIPQRVPDKADVVRGKPPKPHVKSTYFVEYQFPVTASSEDSMATEVMRVVSKKVMEKDGQCEVQFGHRSVFPVQFDGSTVDHWWTRLLVLRVYHKLAGQKTPSLIAVASTPLRSILKSPDFSVTFDLPVVCKDAAGRLSSSMSSSFTTDTTTSPDEQSQQLGVMKVSIELTSDSKDFTAALTRMKVAELKGSKVVPLPTAQRPRSSSRERQSHKGRGRETTPRLTERVTTESTRIRTMTSDSKGEEVEDDGPAMTEPRDEEQEPLTLHTLLMIADGQGITVQGMKPLSTQNQRGTTQSVCRGRDFVTRNPYLICKMFWSDDAVHSHVCWGTTEPQFNFSQVAPVLLTPSLLERTRNNFMVVEVWDKKTSGHNDVLVGIAKLPLHQFYMSFRDQKIATAILKSQYPVVGIDNYAPVIDPFSGVHYGQIRVLLAMGAFHQISSLQRLKGDAVTDVRKPERPSHYLERSEKPQQEEEPGTKDDYQEHVQVEHIFEVVVEGVRSLPQGDDSVWGEADCFIQYHFPSQETQYNHLQGSLSLRSFRTATTLCLPDPVFNEVTRHRISLPHDVPVQRELLSACVGVGGAAGCIPLELWCRYYYPNVRDQVIAKAFLPLAKLCAMVTMQRRGEPSIQTFNLPLKAQQEGEGGTQVSSGGFLDVTVSYRQSSHRIDHHPTELHPLSSSFPQATLTVAVLRASGLQAAAESLARYHQSLQYASEVGVNAFTTVQLSFLRKEELKRSRTIARSFAPELSHHMDLACPMILQCEGQRSGPRETSLAEVLETADVVIKVWHQAQQSHENHPVDVLYPGEDANIAERQLVAPPREILLGSTTMPLRNLLLKRTGITGWFTVTTPLPNGWDPTNHGHHRTDDATSTLGDHDPLLPGHSRDGGSIELVIRFAQKADHEKVVQVGQRMGWTPPMSLEDQETAECLSLPVTLAIQIDRIMFHERSLLKPGQTRISIDSHVYVRYQFYDKRPTCSQFMPIKQSHEGQLSANVKHTEHVKITMSPSLTWYMKEEQFVIQVWSSQDAKKGTLPKKADRQIGSAHIDMTELVIGGGRHRKISGLHPLSKPGVNNMHGACLRGTITLTIGEQLQPTPEETSCDGEMISEEEEVELVRGEDEVTDDQPLPVCEPEVMEPAPFELHIERAIGLCTSPQRWNSAPLSTYVSLTVSDAATLLTPTVPDSTRPVWNHHQEIVLNPQDVVEKQHLIFKVWHQTTGRQDMSCDRMLGFTSVDLGPLLVGFRSLNGWYNIMDFSGQVKGQIKIAITPKRDLSMLKPRAIQFMGQNSLPCVSGHLLPIHSRPPHHLPPPPRSTPSGGHHGEHVRGVRESHEKLRHTHTQEGAEEDPALSRLKENLRKNLADLDSLKEHLDKKRRGLDGHQPSLDERNEYANEPESHRGGLLTEQSVERSLTNRTEDGLRTGAYRDINSDMKHSRDVTTSGSPVEDLDAHMDVQYHRILETKEALEAVQEGEEEMEEDVPSDSLEDSESDIEGDIVIPRTLNEVVTDEGIRLEKWGQGGQWREYEGGSVMNAEETSPGPPGGMEDVETGHRIWGPRGYEGEQGGCVNNLEEGAQGYETPEEALERIQQRIMQVVGPEAVTMATGETSPRIRDVAGAPRIGQPPDMFSHTVSVLRGREADSEVICISEDEGGGGSTLSESPSEREELASFASSRDEGENVETLEVMSNKRPRTSSPRRDVPPERGEGMSNGHLLMNKAGYEGELDQDSGIKSGGISTLIRDESVEQYHTGERQHGSSEGMRSYPDAEEMEESPRSAESREFQSQPVEKPRTHSRERGVPEDTSVAFTLPNFFLPRDDLASAMRTLDSAVSGPPASRVPEIGSLSERIQAAREIAMRMEDDAKAGKPSSLSNRPKKFTRAPPTAEEAKRIARIFATKYSPP